MGHVLYGLEKIKRIYHVDCEEKREDVLPFLRIVIRWIQSVCPEIDDIKSETLKSIKECIDKISEMYVAELEMDDNSVPFSRALEDVAEKIKGSQGGEGDGKKTMKNTKAKASNSARKKRRSRR